MFYYLVNAEFLNNLLMLILISFFFCLAEFSSYIMAHMFCTQIQCCHTHKHPNTHTHWVQVTKNSFCNNNFISLFFFIFFATTDNKFANIAFYIYYIIDECSFCMLYMCMCVCVSVYINFCSLNQQIVLASFA